MCVCVCVCVCVYAHFPTSSVETVVQAWEWNEGAWIEFTHIGMAKVKSLTVSASVQGQQSPGMATNELWGW